MLPRCYKGAKRTKTSLGGGNQAPNLMQDSGGVPKFQTTGPTAGDRRKQKRRSFTSPDWKMGVILTLATSKEIASGKAGTKKRFPLERALSRAEKASSKDERGR